MFDGFAEEMVEADGLELFVRHGGAGPAVLLLHGHPRTSATWHRVAPQLVARGLYGDPLVIWRYWAHDVRGHGIDAGHHMAELAPDDLATALGTFLV